jgi:3-deoxy-D-manno-octulosonic-acid transferase
MFFLYQLFVLIVIILSPIILIIRLLKGKEDPKRLSEKFFLKKNSNLKNNILWFHAASIGEFLSIVPLIYELEKNKKINKILITTTTVSSSKLFKNYKFRKTEHQFFPIDNFIFCKRFLNYWKPKVAIFIDSEIWPNMFKELNNQSIPLLLMNARITKKSFSKWKLFEKFALKTFSYISKAYPQNNETYNFLKELKVKNIEIIGNLKFIKNTKDKNLNLNKSLLKKFKKRVIFVASSTHKSEEKLIASSHLLLKKKIKNILTIIIPRHTQRVKEIIMELKSLGLNTFIHNSKNNLDSDTDVYVVNTYGETKKFLKYANLVFMGGSIIKHGGQNPIEPAHYHLRVIHGPNVGNFKEIYQFLEKNKISYKIKNLKQLTSTASKLLKNKSKKINLDKLGRSILDNSLSEIKYFLNNEIKKT